MKKLIKLITFLTLCLFFTGMTSCSDNEDNSLSDSSELQGNWKVIHYIIDGKKITKTEENTWSNINNGDINIKLTLPDEDGKGEVSGKSVTNSLGGNYTLGDNNAITFYITTTLIAEPEWGLLFQIYKVDKYNIKNGKLYLHYDSNLIVLEKQ